MTVPTETYLDAKLHPDLYTRYSRKTLDLIASRKLIEFNGTLEGRHIYAEPWWTRALARVRGWL